MRAILSTMLLWASAGFSLSNGAVLIMYCQAALFIDSAIARDCHHVVSGEKSQLTMVANNAMTKNNAAPVEAESAESKALEHRAAKLREVSLRYHL